MEEAKAVISAYIELGGQRLIIDGPVSLLTELLDALRPKEAPTGKKAKEGGHGS